MPVKNSALAVQGSVKQLGEALSALARLCRNPGNTSALARHEAALFAALAKHQFICSALGCAQQPRQPHKVSRKRR